MAIRNHTSESGRGFSTFEFDPNQSLTTNDVAVMIDALKRSIQKWGELSTSPNCSKACKDYNLSQAIQLSEIAKLLKSLQVEEAEEVMHREISNEFKGLLNNL